MCATILLLSLPSCTSPDAWKSMRKHISCWDRLKKKANLNRLLQWNRYRGKVLLNPSGCWEGKAACGFSSPLTTSCVLLYSDDGMGTRWLPDMRSVKFFVPQKRDKVHHCGQEARTLRHRTIRYRICGFCWSNSSVFYLLEAAKRTQYIWQCLSLVMTFEIVFAIPLSHP